MGTKQESGSVVQTWLPHPLEKELVSTADAGLKETIDGRGEREVKDLLAVTVVELAHYYADQRSNVELSVPFGP